MKYIKTSLNKLFNLFPLKLKKIYGIIIKEISTKLKPKKSIVISCLIEFGMHKSKKIHAKGNTKTRFFNFNKYILKKFY